MPRTTTRPSNDNGFRVGQRVKLRIGKTIFRALIVEDRGHIGVKGRRLWRVRALQNGPVAEGETFEWPEENLIPA